jgi:hypothetical protein
MVGSAGTKSGCVAARVDDGSELMKGFFAYPAQPALIGGTIEGAVKQFNHIQTHVRIDSWRALDIPGRFIAHEVMSSIDAADFLAADITRLNFNVTFEIGYCIGRKKRLVLTRNRAIVDKDADIRQFGIYDIIGHSEYENQAELVQVLRSLDDTKPIEFVKRINRKAPVYFLDTRWKTDFSSRILARLKRTGLHFRAFDPQEQPRLSAPEAMSQVAQSLGVVLQLQGENIEDHHLHNLRASFLSGLARGMEKELLFLQDADGPAPMDFRDLVSTCTSLESIDAAIARFAPRVVETMQREGAILTERLVSHLEEIDLGASAAENEYRDLYEYYVETDGYLRARRGEARLVVGRKGSGKTAVFYQIRDNAQRGNKSVILDLKPEGYKLVKLKDTVLRLLDAGSFEHTITAFWEYLLWVEIGNGILELDRTLHQTDHRLFEPYLNLERLYGSDDSTLSRSFSERLAGLVDRVAARYQDRYGDGNNVSLTDAQVTEIIHDQDIVLLKTTIDRYLKFKEIIWVLIDNLDKGWPAHGLAAGDLLIIRTLLESMRKVHREVRSQGLDAHGIVFLRNDVYELLIEESPDRGKESKVVLDWSDPKMLKELVRRRLARAYSDKQVQFEDIWLSVCASHYQGEDSAEFLIDRCLMRPRYLINLINYCKGHAINIGHERIEEDDIREGLRAFSNDLVEDIDLEIRDVFPDSENLLYAFIGAPYRMTMDDICSILIDSGVTSDSVLDAIDVLLWYGFLGLAGNGTEPQYIYSVTYNMHVLRGIHSRLAKKGAIYTINPAFWSGLQVEGLPNELQADLDL